MDISITKGSGNQTDKRWDDRPSGQDESYPGETGTRNVNLHPEVSRGRDESRLGGEHLGEALRATSWQDNLGSVPKGSDQDQCLTKSTPRVAPGDPVGQEATRMGEDSTNNSLT